MPQAAFAYAAAPQVVAPGADLACDLALSIFADRAHVRGELRDDAEAGGFCVTRQDNLAALIDGPAGALGDVVLADCPAADAARLAALARLDVRAAHAGVRLIVSTSVAALDEVFACLDQSAPRILVDPSRAERVIALGEARVAMAHGRRVREMSEEDRLVMLRLSEQVGQIARRLDGLAPPVASVETASSVRAATTAFRFAPRDAAVEAAPEPTSLARSAACALPDPRAVRRLIRQRQLRGRYLDADLFADPAWDMLLDLTAATAEQARVSVTSLCIASGVPPTTALRWIGQMTEAGLLRRVEDRTDRRRAFIMLTDRSHDAMAAYFADVGEAALAA